MRRQLASNGVSKILVMHQYNMDEDDDDDADSIGMLLYFILTAVIVGIVIWGRFLYKQLKKFLANRKKRRQCIKEEDATPAVSLTSVSSPQTVERDDIVIVQGQDIIKFLPGTPENSVRGGSDIQYLHQVDEESKLMTELQPS
eukprot:TRINITY_DN13114_c0_g2_i1.p1 TRINITY_DN13114_c0_g2~~TRINITY_DN13114_c0_g2_i1.p1  ORF type:complete len:143 (-),score=2.50 TRINITY_DN13114_c0_g2_i1:245-673(-)